jgi:hypothetical protein
MIRFYSEELLASRQPQSCRINPYRLSETAYSIYSQLPSILEAVLLIRVLVCKAVGRMTLGRPTCRWEDNIKTDLRKRNEGVWTGSRWLRIGGGGGNW